MASQPPQQTQQQQQGLLRGYYLRKIEELSALLRERQQNQRRLEAQRNALNAQVRALKE